MDPVQPEASIVQVGLGVRYVGQYAYAYSGLVANSGAAVYEGISFRTGSGIIVGEIRSFGWIDDTNITQGKDLLSRIKFNGLTIGLIKTEPAAADMPSYGRFKVVIPPLTLVEVELQSFESDANTYAGATLTGRVYGAE